MRLSFGCIDAKRVPKVVFVLAAGLAVGLALVDLGGV